MGQFEKGSTDMTTDAVVAAHEALGNPPLVTVVNNKPPAWVMLDGRDQTEGPTEPSVAVRITTSEDPEALLEQTIQDVELTESVRRHGGRVLEVLETPRRIGRFVAVISRYLPGKDVDPHDYGHSMATMHNASVAAGLSNANRPFDPLRPTRQTYQYLVEQQASGRPFRIGQTVFPRGLLNELGEHLTAQEAAVQQVLGMMAVLGLQPVLLQQDVHFGNVRYNKDGIATLMDLDDPIIGPGEADLGRVRTQWTQRFSQPVEREQSFLAAYAAEVEQSSNPNILALTDQIMLLRYSCALADLAINQVQLGVPTSEWLLREGMYRLEHIGDPTRKWRPLNQERKDQLADEASS